MRGPRRKTLARRLAPGALLFALAAPLVSSCGRAGGGPEAGKSVAAPDAASSPTPTAPPAGAVITPNGVRAAGDAPATARPESYLSGDIKIVPVEIKEKNGRLRYELGVSYPQIERPGTAGEHSFNRLVRRLVERDVRDFKAHCAKERRYADGTEREMEYSFTAEYEEFFVTRELLSVVLRQHYFVGHVNADHVNIPLNYDLKAARQMSLSDLFKPRSKFLEAISSYCVAEFEKRGKEYGLGCGSEVDEAWMRKGTAPKTENYEGWALARNGLLIVFGEYQIGPGCAGMIDAVMPYESLKEVFKSGLKLPPPPA